jgi:hypothetical protein
MVIADQEVDSSYLDVTGEEVLAAASAVGSAPPAQVVGAGVPDASMVESAVRVGTRSLRARGLLRTFDSDEQIDQALADCVSIAGAPTGVTVVVQASPDQQALTWIYLDSDRLVAISTLEPGLFRLRLLPIEGYGAALSIISELDDASFVSSLDEFRLDLSGVVDAVEALPVDQRLADSSTAIAAVHSAMMHMDRAAMSVLEGREGSVTSVVSVLPSPDGGPVRHQTTWFASTDGEWSRLDVAGNVIAGTPTTPKELLNELQYITQSFAGS